MSSDIVELEENLEDSPLYSEDLALVPKEKRTWTMWNLAAIWVGMAVCIPTYMLASDMIRKGVSWHIALLIVGLANLIITVPMVLNGHAGVKYGVPFPVLGRSSFGTKGIHIAAVVRGVVACGWFGIQTWIGGLALYAIWNVFTGSEASLGLDFGKFVGFGLFWLINVYFIWNGTESIKWLEEFSAPILILIGILLISWGAYNANGFGIVLDQSEQLEKPEAVITYEGSIDQYVLNLNPLRNKEGFIKASYFQLSTEGNTSIGPDAEHWMQFNRHKLNILLNEFDPDVNWEDVMNGEKQVGIQFRADGDDKFDFIYSSVVPVQVSSESATTGSKMWSYIMANYNGGILGYHVAEHCRYYQVRILTKGSGKRAVHRIAWHNDPLFICRSICYMCCCY